MHVPTRPTRRRSLFTSAIGLAVGVAALATVATGALFTDSAANGGNSFSTGDVEITTTPASEIVSFSSPKMMPGDSVVDDVTVTNAGTVELRYAVSSATTEDALAGQLDLSVWAEAAEADAGGANSTCDATPPATSLYGPGDLGSQAGVAVIGNSSQGSQAGDRVLAAATAEVLCFRVALPFATDNSYQGLTTTATFAFDAEQTANNS